MKKRMARRGEDLEKRSSCNATVIKMAKQRGGEKERERGVMTSLILIL